MAGIALVTEHSSVGNLALLAFVLGLPYILYRNRSHLMKSVLAVLDVAVQMAVFLVLLPPVIAWVIEEAYDGNPLAIPALGLGCGCIINIYRNGLYSMMATLQPTVARMAERLRLLRADHGEFLVVPNPRQGVEIPDELPINPHARAAVEYQAVIPPLADYSSDSSDDNR